MNVDSYFQRISYSGSRLPSLDTLRNLSMAHIRSVPFENFSVIAKERIEIDEKLLYDKIVNRRRGGFCYELNGLFQWLLKSLGFDVIFLAARVLNHRTKLLGPEFDHLALSVAIPGHRDERYLVDVGIPITSGCSLMISDGSTERHGDVDIRLRVATLETWLLEMKEIGSSSEWNLRYQFTLQPRRLSDYMRTCLYHQTSPEAPFVQKRFAVIALKDGGRIVFTDEGEKGPRIVETKRDTKGNCFVKTERLLEECQVNEELKFHFGLEL